MSDIVKKIVLIFLLFISTSSFAQVSDDVTDDEAKVSELYLNGKWALNVVQNAQLASKYFLKVIEIDSLNAPAHYDLATIISDDKIALLYAKKAVSIDSTNAFYLRLLSGLYVKNNDFDSSIKVAKKLCKLEPEKDNSLYLITLYARSKQNDEALKTLDSLQSIYGESEEFDDFRADVIRGMQGSPKVVAMIKSMIENDSTNVNLKVLLGNKYLEQNKDSLAFIQYDKAINLEPSNIRAIISLFDFYNFKGDKEKLLEYIPLIIESDDVKPSAKKDIYFNALVRDEYMQKNHQQTILSIGQSLLLQYPEDLEVVTIITQQLVAMNRKEDAEKLLKSFIDKGTDDIRAYYTIIEFEKNLGDYEEAIKYCDYAGDKFIKKRYVFVDMKVYLLILNNQNERAIVLLKKEVKRTSNQKLKSRFYTGLGDIYAIDKNLKKSFKYYKKAILVDKQNINAMNNYSFLLADNGTELEEALSMALTVIDKEPSNPIYLDTYAWVLYKMGKYEQAKKAMSKAIALDTSNSSDLFLHYGDILFKLNQNIMAQEYWKKALEAGADASEVSSRMEMIK